MIWNFEYLIVYTSTPGVLPQQNDQYQIQPWKVNEIKAYKNIEKFLENCRNLKETGRKFEKIVVIDRQMTDIGDIWTVIWQNTAGNFIETREKFERSTL